MQTVSHATASRSSAYESIPLIRETLARTRSYSATSRMTGYPEATIRQIMAPPPPRSSFVVEPIPLPLPTHTRLSPREFIMLCCAEEGLKYADITGDCRRRYLAWPRQRFMWLMRKAKPSLSLPEIGRRFGGRDHTTVIHALRITEDRYLRDEEERAKMDALVSALAEVEAPLQAASSLDAEIAALHARLATVTAQRAAINAVAMRAAS